MLSKLWQDPAALNYLLLCIYVANGGRWLWFGERSQALYWVAAFLITLAVTLQAKGWR